MFDVIVKEQNSFAIFCPYRFFFFLILLVFFNLIFLSRIFFRIPIYFELQSNYITIEFRASDANKKEAYYLIIIIEFEFESNHQTIAVYSYSVRGVYGVTLEGG